MISCKLGNVFIPITGKKKSKSELTGHEKVSDIERCGFFRPVTSESRTDWCCRPCRGVLLNNSVLDI